jgi:acyl-CoA thioesterase FadM
VLPLLRLLKTLAGPIGPHRQDPSATCVTHWRVWPNDVDAFGHMNNGRYQVLMDLGRIHFLRQCNLMRGVVRNRWVVPVGEVHMAYRKPLRPFEGYALHTRILHWDERWFYFRQDFFRRADPSRCVATGHVKTIFVGRGGAVPTATVVRELAGRELAAPPLTTEVSELFRRTGADDAARPYATGPGLALSQPAEPA